MLGSADFHTAIRSTMRPLQIEVASGGPELSGTKNEEPRGHPQAPAHFFIFFHFFVRPDRLRCSYQNPTTNARPDLWIQHLSYRLTLEQPVGVLPNG